MVTDSQKIFSALGGRFVECITENEKDFIKKMFNIDNDKKIDSIEFEQPDALIVNENTVYAIEHFQIDYSELTKNGSSFYRKYHPSLFHKKIKENRKYIISNKVFYSHEKISTVLNYSNLYNNFISCFNKHYEKIDSYKSHITNNLKREIKHIECLFFVEYKVVFPSMIKTKEDKIIAVYPHNDINVINFIKSKKNISGVFFYVPPYNEIEDSVSFVLNEKRSISCYKLNKKNIFNLQKENLIEFENPNVIEYGIKI